MKAIEFEGQTLMLNPPADWCQSKGLQCGMLPVREGVLSGMPVLYSHWQPSNEERQMILQGAAIRLCVVGAKHPPVSVETVFCKAGA